jgi:hypothetical protein
MDFLLRISVFGDGARMDACAEQRRVEIEEAFEKALTEVIHINLCSTPFLNFDFKISEGKGEVLIAFQLGRQLI